MSSPQASPPAPCRPPIPARSFMVLQRKDPEAAKALHDRMDADIHARHERLVQVRGRGGRAGRAAGERAERGAGWGGARRARQRRPSSHHCSAHRVRPLHCPSLLLPSDVEEAGAGA